MSNLPKIVINSFTMPHTAAFTCFEDDAVKITNQISFSSGTNVSKIDVTLENKNSEKYELAHIMLCQEEEINNQSVSKKYFYRVLLVDNADTSNPSTYILDGNELGNLSLAKHNEAQFLFHVISKSEIDHYKDTCDFVYTKPRTKDGYIIVSL
ncbi:hypothetical protein [Mesonia sp.]|uniref:hypothetical protein n=1 Tax=Mesonia sp. TaxID=1960830 RepID=UPI001754F270|nr:hypothetical protein [Mesonia sp.]HIB38604.1 hypothetical protein [Mesonia sp.]HIO26099.1 hypothetical protein [Flavobacteriaceae bacterium]